MKLTKTEEDLFLYGDKCNFYLDKNTKTVICTTTYKNESIRGVAKCNPEDVFDVDIGKVLAYSRCKQKLAKKKLQHARKVYGNALRDEDKARRNLLKAFSFVHDSEEYLHESNYELKILTERLVKEHE